MKLQIDTVAKTIKVDENVKFKELIKVLKKMFPDTWDDYSLVGNEVIYWYNPIPWTYVNPQPLPWITYTAGTYEYQPLPEGSTSVFNIDVQV